MASSTGLDLHVSPLEESRADADKEQLVVDANQYWVGTPVPVAGPPLPSVPLQDEGTVLRPDDSGIADTEDEIPDQVNLAPSRSISGSSEVSESEVTKENVRALKRRVKELEKRMKEREKKEVVDQADHCKLLQKKNTVYTNFR